MCYKPGQDWAETIHSDRVFAASRACCHGVLPGKLALICRTISRPASNTRKGKAEEFMNLLERDAEYLAAAIAEAEESWNEGGIPIGAVLVDEQGAIVARGHNRRVQDSDPTAHAEMVCIKNAGRRRNWSRLTLVSTLSPCSMCSGAAILFNIPRVIIGENATFMGAEDWMKQSGISLRVLNDERCIALMRRMQQERADLWAEDIGK